MAWLLAGPVTCTTISIMGRSPLLRRNVSRTTRFARFRSTACRKARLLTIRPIRAVCIVLAAAVRRNGPLRRRRVADSKTRLKSLGSLSRKVLGKPAVSSFNENESGGQALAPLGPSRIDHLASTRRRHTGTEPMRTLALQVARLKGSFHDACTVFRQACREGGGILGTLRYGVK